MVSSELAIPLPAWVLDEMGELTRAEIRRRCRQRGFDWRLFMESRSERSIADAVYRRLKPRLRFRRSGVSVGIDTVVEFVGETILEWDRVPGLRPTEREFREEQARRGSIGRETQRDLADEREAKMLELVAEGLTNKTEIARRVGVNRSTVHRVLGDVKARADAPVVVDDVFVEQDVCTAAEISAAERWPVVQFMRATGVTLDVDSARWLADMGRCYEAEGRETDLMDAIRASGGAVVRDPWAYLQRCVSNRGDAWTVRAQVLADVLTWAGEKRLDYALVAIGTGGVGKPLPYLRQVLADAVGKGERVGASFGRPASVAVDMARRLAPSLVVVDVDEAMARDTEAETERRGGFIESFRRRWGRLPWEPDGKAEADDCPIGLKGSVDDSHLLSDNGEINSSPGAVKANATVSPLGETFHERCSHPLVGMLTAGMELERVEWVECAAGCGHWLYSDRGPLVCPCHWDSGRVRALSRGLQAAQEMPAGVRSRARESSWDVSEQERC